MSRAVCIDTDNPEAGYFIDSIAIRILDEMYPIKFPYNPIGKIKIFVNCFKSSVDTPDGGDDTEGILYFRFPDGQMEAVKRFFKMEFGEVSEITPSEFASRRIVASKLKLNSKYGKGNVPE